MALPDRAIEAIAAVDIFNLVAWLSAISVTEWAGMSDPAWHGADGRCRPIAERVLALAFPGCNVSGIGLFVLAPGQLHPMHTDEQPPDWVTRIHVPIVTNERATATTDDGTIHMAAGIAYRFNTRARHAVANHGLTPRVHLVFDVRRNA